MTVEIREFNNKAFKHFVLGHNKDKDSSTIIWTQIECRVGPIRIHENEVLNIDDAIKLFNSCCDKKELPNKYNKRNTTKLFLGKE